MASVIALMPLWFCRSHGSVRLLHQLSLYHEQLDHWECLDILCKLQLLLPTMSLLVLSAVLDGMLKKCEAAQPAQTSCSACSNQLLMAFSVPAICVWDLDDDECLALCDEEG